MTIGAVQIDLARVDDMAAMGRNDVAGNGVQFAERDPNVLARAFFARQGGERGGVLETRGAAGVNGQALDPPRLEVLVLCPDVYVMVFMRLRVTWTMYFLEGRPVIR
jgi:hypothetical protein